MESYYWITRLRLSRLLRLIRGSRRENVALVTYIGTSRTAAIGLKLLTGLKLVHFHLRRVESRDVPAGPRLEIASVRNDRGEVITIDILHHILDIRRQILENLTERYKDIDLFKRQDRPDMIAACLGLKIAREITPAVYLAHYARWHRRDDEGGRESPVNNILVLAGRWTIPLKEHLGPLVNRVITERQALQTLPLHLFKLLIRTLQCILKSGTHWPLDRSFSNREDPDAGRVGLKDGKILAAYTRGIFPEKRNDIPYLHASRLKPERLALMFNHPDLLPDQEELDWLKENRVTCFQGPDLEEKIPGSRPWQPSLAYRKHLKDFYRLYLKTLRAVLRSGGKNIHWLLDEAWHLGMNSARWQDFFSANRIGILVHHTQSRTHFIQSLALAETGGIVCTMERSIQFDYCTYLHNSPAHLRFVTGPFSLTQIPESSYSRYSLQTGALNVGENHQPIEGIKDLRRRVRFVAAVFDELPGEWFFGDSVEELYRTLIDLVDKDDRFGLLVKTKKPRVLEVLAAVGKEIRRLEKEGKCLIADWKTTVSAAANRSDIVILVPSTAAFESVLLGKRTLLYNPMRSGSKLFYRNNGLGRRVFENPRSLEAALQQFADGNDDSIGDCRDLVGIIDPYNDGKGARRVGDYLEWCLEGLDAGLDRRRVIDRANRRFGQHWGEEKISEEPASSDTEWMTI